MLESRWCRAALLCVVLALSACSGDGEAPASIPATLSVALASRVEVGQPLALSSSAGANPQGLSFEWDFGDGNTSREVAPVHRYAAAGRYAVRLVVRNGQGEQIRAGSIVEAGRYSNVQGLACSGESAGSGWCWQGPLPRGNGMADAEFVDAQRGWVVGEAGLMLRTDDGGAHWTAVPNPATRTLRQIRFADALNGWAVGDGGTLLRTVDGGRQWSAYAVQGMEAAQLSRLWAVDARTVVVAGVVHEPSGSHEGVWVSADAGTNWMTHSVDLASLQVGRNGTVWTSWGASLSRARPGDWWMGSVLTLPASQRIKAIGAGADGLVRAWVGSAPAPLVPGEGNGLPIVLPPPADERAEVHVSTDGGSSWRVLPMQLPAGVGGIRLTGAKLLPDGTGWAWSGDHQLLRTADGGEHWAVAAAPGHTSYGQAEDAAAFVDARTVVAYSGRQSRISTDAGRTWQPLPPTSDDSVWRPPALVRRDASGALLWKDAWAFQGYSPLHRSTDEGVSWQRVAGSSEADSAMTLALNGIWFADGALGVAQTQEGRLLLSNDGGRQWHDLSTDQACEACRAALHRPRDGSLWRERAGALMRSVDQGRSWTAQDLPPAVRDRYYLQIASAQVAWAQTPTGVYRSLDGARSWSLVPLPMPDGVQRVAFAGPQVGALISGEGNIWHSADGGHTWQRARADLQLRRGGRIHFLDEQRGWMLGGAGQAMSTRDGGLSWQAVRLPVNVQLYDLAFTADAQHGWLVGEGGTILATGDGGRSWVQQRSGTERSLRAVWAMDAGTAWVVGEGGTMLTTATGGR